MQKEQSREGTAPSAGEWGALLSCSGQTLGKQPPRISARSVSHLWKIRPWIRRVPPAGGTALGSLGVRSQPCSQAPALGPLDWAQGLFSDGTESFPRHLQVSFSPGASHTTPIYDAESSRGTGPEQGRPASTPSSPQTSRVTPGHPQSPADSGLASGARPPPAHPPGGSPASGPTTHGSRSSPQTEPAWQPLSSLCPLPGTGVTATWAWRQKGLPHPRARPCTCLMLDEFSQQERVLPRLHSGPALGPRCA